MPLRSRLLLDETGHLPDDELRVAEDSLFAILRMPNGTHKLTEWLRLTELDESLAAVLGRRGELCVLDVGASSGVTTAEMVMALKQVASGVRCTAIDLFVHADVETYTGGLELLVHRSTGRVIEASLSRLYVVDDIWTVTRPLALVRMAAIRFLSALRRAPFVKALKKETQYARLQSQKARDLIDNFEEMDLFVRRLEWLEHFDVVRAANILNHVYFPTELLSRALGHLVSYVKLGGYLVLARSVDDRIHASILQRSVGGLSVIHRIGDGSEVEALAIKAASAFVKSEA